MEVAAQIVARDQTGQRSGQRRRHLAAAFAQLGRDDRQAECGVEVGFFSEWRRERIAEAAFVGQFAQRLSVSLRAAPGDEFAAPALGGDDAQLGAESAIERHANVALAALADLADQRQGRERVEERAGIGGDGEEIDVADGIGPAPQAACEGDTRHAALAQESQQLVGYRQRRADTVPTGIERELREAVAHRLLGPRAEPFRGGDLPGVCRFLQGIQRGHAEQFVEACGGLHADAGEIGEADHRGGDDLSQLIQRTEAAALGDLDDRAADPLADPLDRLQLRRAQPLRGRSRPAMASAPRR